MLTCRIENAGLRWRTARHMHSSLQSGYNQCGISSVAKCFKKVLPCTQLGKSFYAVPRCGLSKCLILLRSPLYFRQLHRIFIDTIREMSIIEAPSKSMLEKSLFSLITHFYMIESWFTQVHCRPLILTLLMFCLVLCFAACLRSSTKEREVWRRPLVYPSSVPVIGHLLLMGWDLSRFVSTVVLVIVYA